MLDFYPDQINGVIDMRNAKIEELEAITKAAEDAGEDELDEERQTKFDVLKGEIDGHEGRIDRLKETQAIAAKRSVPVIPNDDETKGIGHNSGLRVTGGKKVRQKGTFFARQAHCLFIAKNNIQVAADYARDVLNDDEMSAVLRAPHQLVMRAASLPADTGTSAYAGVLTTINEAASEFIALLRPMSVMAQTPSRRMNFDGDSQIKIPRQTAGVTGAYIGEGTAIPVNALAFDSVTLVPKKIGVITAATNEMLSRSSPSLEALLRDDMLQGTATTVDATFLISGVGTAVKPPGLDSFTTPIPGEAGADHAAILVDLEAAVAALANAQVPFRQPVWIMNTVQHTKLQFIQDPAAGGFAFQAMLAAGNLMGFPFIVSTSMTAGNLFLVDGDFLVIAEDLAPLLTLSEDAVIHMDDDPVDVIGSDDGVAVAAQNIQSMFQLDQVALRLTWRHDWSMRNAVAIAHINAITW